MERRISFATRPDGERIAYATMGHGPVIVRPPGWINHLQVEWDHPRTLYGRHVSEQLAAKRTVVWYDRHGTGLSDRHRTDFSLLDDLVDLQTVVQKAGLARFALFGISDGGPTAIAYANQHPDQVTSIVLYGTSASRSPSRFQSFAIRRIIADLIRADWNLASRALSDIFSPSGTTAEVMLFAAQLEREAAAPDVAASLFETEVDVTELLSGVVAPVLVLHRRGDQVIPFEAGREMARLLPNSRFVPLDGDVHTLLSDDVIAEINAFLDEAPTQPDRGSIQADNLLSHREVEVLRLVAVGRSNQQIAEELVISPNTVAKHLNSIFTKTESANRTEAASYAHRQHLL